MTLKRVMTSRWRIHCSKHHVITPKGRLFGSLSQAWIAACTKYSALKKRSTEQ